MAYIDPELEPALREMPPLRLDGATLSQVRVAREAMYAQPPPASPAIVENFVVPGPDGALPVPVTSYRPPGNGTPLPALLHIHGGGYVLGSPGMMDAANHGLALALGCRILSVDYRLAPETPFPGPLEDCYAALVWLHRQAATLGVDADRIGVKGESAGGGLAAGLALLARDRGGPGLAFQHLIYPMIDDRTGSTADPHPFTGEFAWTPAHNRFGWTSYLGRPPGDAAGDAEVSPHAAPARAVDLRGLPPTFIAVGGLDLFLDEDILFAQRLSRAGVPVALHVYPGAFHGFQRIADAAVAKAANRDSLEALKRSFAEAASPRS